MADEKRRHYVVRCGLHDKIMAYSVISMAVLRAFHSVDPVSGS